MHPSEQALDLLSRPVRKFFGGTATEKVEEVNKRTKWNRWNENNFFIGRYIVPWWFASFQSPRIHLLDRHTWARRSRSQENCPSVTIDLPVHLEQKCSSFREILEPLQPSSYE